MFLIFLSPPFNPVTPPRSALLLGMAKQIGCSDYFTTGSTIAKRISRQMEENLISETSGLNFEWWCIWERQPNYRYVDEKMLKEVKKRLQKWGMNKNENNKIRQRMHVHLIASNEIAFDALTSISSFALSSLLSPLSFSLLNKIQLNINIDIYVGRHEANVRQLSQRRAPAKSKTKTIMMKTIMMIMKSKFLLHNFPQIHLEFIECDPLFAHTALYSGSHVPIHVRKIFSTFFDNFPIRLLCRVFSEQTKIQLRKKQSKRHQN